MNSMDHNTALLGLRVQALHLCGAGGVYCHPLCSVVVPEPHPSPSRWGWQRGLHNCARLPVYRAKSLRLRRCSSCEVAGVLGPACSAQVMATWFFSPSRHLKMGAMVTVYWRWTYMRPRKRM